MVNGIDEKSEKKAYELMEQHDQLLKQFGGKLPEIGELQKIEDVFPSMSNGLKKTLARTYYEKGKLDEAAASLKDVPMDDEVGDLKKKLARAYYDAGELDEAIDSLYGVPKDDETHELHRMFRYADEARSIVSQVSPETQKHFAELAERLGIKRGNDEKENAEG